MYFHPKRLTATSRISIVERYLVVARVAQAAVDIGGVLVIRWIEAHPYTETTNSLNVPKVQQLPRE
jgi:hypothetical protein